MRTRPYPQTIMLITETIKRTKVKTVALHPFAPPLSDVDLVDESTVLGAEDPYEDNLGPGEILKRLRDGRFLPKGEDPTPSATEQ